MEPHSSDAERKANDEQSRYALLFLIWFTANLAWFTFWGDSWRQENWRAGIIIGLAVANLGWIELWLDTGLRRSLRAIWMVMTVGWIGYGLYPVLIWWSYSWWHWWWYVPCPQCVRTPPPDFLIYGVFHVPMLITFAVAAFGAVPWLSMAFEKEEPDQKV